MNAVEVTHWNLSPGGQIEALPVLDFGVCAVFPRHVALRIDYALSPDHLRELRAGHAPPSRCQLSMTAEQARELASLLSDYARVISSGFS